MTTYICKIFLYSFIMCIIVNTSYRLMILCPSKTSIPSAIHITYSNIKLILGYIYLIKTRGPILSTLYVIKNISYNIGLKYLYEYLIKTALYLSQFIPNRVMSFIVYILLISINSVVVLELFICSLFKMLEEHSALILCSIFLHCIIYYNTNLSIIYFLFFSFVLLFIVTMYKLDPSFVVTIIRDMIISYAIGYILSYMFCIAIKCIVYILPGGSSTNNSLNQASGGGFNSPGGGGSGPPSRPPGQGASPILDQLNERRRNRYTTNTINTTDSHEPEAYFGNSTSIYTNLPASRRGALMHNTREKIQYITKPPNPQAGIRGEAIYGSGVSETTKEQVGGSLTRWADVWAKEDSNRSSGSILPNIDTSHMQNANSELELVLELHNLKAIVASTDNVRSTFEISGFWDWEKINALNIRAARSHNKVLNLAVRNMDSNVYNNYLTDEYANECMLHGRILTREERISGGFFLPVYDYSASYRRHKENIVRLGTSGPSNI